MLCYSAITDDLIRKTDYPYDTFKVSRLKENNSQTVTDEEERRRIIDRTEHDTHISLARYGRQNADAMRP